MQSVSISFLKKLMDDRKRKGSRSRGFEGSSGKGRRLEGWRVRGLAKNRKGEGKGILSRRGRRECRDRISSSEQEKDLF